MEAYFLFHAGRSAGAEAVPVRAEEQDEDIGSPSDSESPSTSTSRGSAAGRSSSSSSELDDDATSSCCCSGSLSGGGFEMSALMAQLPFKRGLSRFFDGKSQSFASLAAVASLDDLPKPPRKRLKPSRSCGGGLDARRGRLLSPRRHCAKKPALPRAAAFPVVLAAVAQTRPPLGRTEGVAGKALVVS